MGKRKAQMRSNTTHVSHVADLLSGKKKPKNERKANEINPKKIDKAIQPFFDSLVKYIVAQKSIVKRVSEAKQSVRTLLMEKWAKEYAKQKERPESVRYMSDEGQSLLHVVTTKTHGREHAEQVLADVLDGDHEVQHHPPVGGQVVFGGSDAFHRVHEVVQPHVRQLPASEKGASELGCLAG